MFEKDCIFCRMITGEVECTKVYEDDQAFAFRDINPQASTHIIIVPKDHIESLNDIARGDEAMLGHLLRLAPKIANQEDIAESGYRTVINTGENSGQSVWHLHVHLLGGRLLSWPPG